MATAIDGNCRESREKETKMADPTRYGRYSWCIELSDGGEIMLAADRMEEEGGVLRFWQHYEYDREGERVHEREDGPLLLFVLPQAQFRAAYAASAIDSSPVAVDWWRQADGTMHVELRGGG